MVVILFEMVKQIFQLIFSKVSGWVLVIKCGGLFKYKKATAFLLDLYDKYDGKWLQFESNDLESSPDMY